MKHYIASVHSVRMLPGSVAIQFTQLPDFQAVVDLLKIIQSHNGEIENIQHERSAKSFDKRLADEGIALPKRVRRDIIWPEEKGSRLIIINEGKDKSFSYWLLSSL